MCVRRSGGRAWHAREALASGGQSACTSWCLPNPLSTAARSPPSPACAAASRAFPGSGPAPRAASLASASRGARWASSRRRRASSSRGSAASSAAGASGLQVSSRPASPSTSITMASKRFRAEDALGLVEGGVRADSCGVMDRGAAALLMAALRVWTASYMRVPLHTRARTLSARYD